MQKVVKNATLRKLYLKTNNMEITDFLLLLSITISMLALVASSNNKKKKVINPNNWKIEIISTSKFKTNNMAQYRKKPVVIEAEQFIVWNENKIPPFITIHGVTFPVNKDCTIIIPTLEGQHIASNLDWIIKGIQGELYPCKPDIFEKIYEPINK